jgi:hypothetical protein
MSPSIGAQVAFFRFRQKGERAFTCKSKLSKHVFLLANQSGVERNRRFEPNEAGFCEPYRQMHALPHWKGAWRFLYDVLGGADDGPLHHDQVGGYFGRAPLFDAGLFSPFLRRYSVSGAQKGRLRFVKFRADRREVQRDLALLGVLNRCAAGLLEGVGQLKHARFSKRGADDL